MLPLCYAAPIPTHVKIFPVIEASSRQSQLFAAVEHQDSEVKQCSGHLLPVDLDALVGHVPGPGPQHQDWLRVQVLHHPVDVVPPEQLVWPRGAVAVVKIHLE